MFKAKITITLRPSILDPQGKAAEHAFANLGLGSIEHVRIGKYVELSIDEADAGKAEELARLACQKLLANEVMEDFVFTLEPAGAEAA